MVNALTPGYLRWDGTKIVSDTSISIAGPTGPAGPVGPSGTTGATGATGSTGASGLTIIPNGGTISGTYQSNILCEGNATLTDNVIIFGDLNVANDLINNDGHNLDVYGSVLCNGDFDFNQADPAQAQGYVNITGNFFFSNIFFRPTLITGSLLTVGGNLIGKNQFSTITANGEDNADGLDISVFGDLTAYDIYISGGNSSTPGNAGKGGSINVYGNCNVSNTLESFGGDNTSLGNAGNGGNVIVKGNFTADELLLSGGDGNNIGAGAGGNGGNFICNGNAVIKSDLESVGGFCNSNNGRSRSGSGGDITVQGNLTGNCNIDISGGVRSGVLVGNFNLTIPSGGDINVKGDCVVSSILSIGGEVTTTGAGYSHGSGKGGDITVNGTLNCYSLEVYGSNSTAYSAGNGGDIFVLNLQPFYGVSANGGSLIVTSFTGLGTCGRGGDIAIYGDLITGYLLSVGGNNNYGSGRRSGNIIVFKNLYASTIQLDGGDCSSVYETANAGGSGTIICGNMHSYPYEILPSSIQGNGGDRAGATTLPGTTTAANGLTIRAQSIHVDSITANGGNVTTATAVADGGNGGSILVYGDFICNGNVELMGGSADLNNGGLGGSIIVSGKSIIGDNIEVIGGNSNDPAMSNGGAGSLTFEGGVQADLIRLLDGSGVGLAATTDIYLRLGGASRIYIIEQQDRAASYIRPFGSGQLPATLQVNILSNKTTLNRSDNSATASVGGNPYDKIYTVGYDSMTSIGGWYEVTTTFVA